MKSWPAGEGTRSDRPLTCPDRPTCTSTCDSALSRRWTVHVRRGQRMASIHVKPDGAFMVPGASTGSSAAGSSRTAPTRVARQAGDAAGSRSSPAGLAGSRMAGRLGGPGRWPSSPGAYVVPVRSEMRRPAGSAIARRGISAGEAGASAESAARRGRIAVHR